MTSVACEVARSYCHADNNPINKTDPLGLRPGDDGTFRALGGGGCPAGMYCSGVGGGYGVSLSTWAQVPAAVCAGYQRPEERSSPPSAGTPGARSRVWSQCVDVTTPVVSVPSDDPLYGFIGASPVRLLCESHVPIEGSCMAGVYIFSRTATRAGAALVEASDGAAVGDFICSNAKWRSSLESELSRAPSWVDMPRSCNGLFDTLNDGPMASIIVVAGRMGACAGIKFSTVFSGRFRPFDPVPRDLGAHVEFSSILVTRTPPCHDS